MVGGSGHWETLLLPAPWFPGLAAPCGGSRFLSGGGSMALGWRWPWFLFS
jgi:hypothetical protein